PRERLPQASPDVECRREPEEPLRLGDVSLRMKNIARTERPMQGLADREARMAFPYEVAQRVVELEQRSAPPQCDVVNLTLRLGSGDTRREQVRLNDVGDMAEIARGAAITVDVHLLAAKHCVYPGGYYRRVRTVGILAPPEHVEVTKADSRQTVAATEYVGIELIDELAYCIRRQRTADHVLDLRQLRVVAVG